MGSPVSPVTADIYMEDFEEMAHSSAPCLPRIYKRYVDDTITILATDNIYIFLNHLNSINNNIQFTIELQANNSLAFLDVLVIRNSNGTIGHTVYRKPTHTLVCVTSMVKRTTILHSYLPLANLCFVEPTISATLNI